MEVALQRDAWHYRLQKWTFGLVPYEGNFCPYFWLTIFCLISCPFAWTYKVLCHKIVRFVYGCTFKPVFFALEALAKWIDEKICEPLIKWSYTKMPVEDVVTLYISERYNHRLKKRDLRILRLWRKYVVGAEDMLRAAEERHWERRERAEMEYIALRRAQRLRKEERIDRSKKVYQHIIKYTQWAMMVLTPIFAGGFILLAIAAVRWCIVNVSAGTSILFCKYAGACVALLVVFVALTFLIQKLLRCAVTFGIPSLHKPVHIPGSVVVSKAYEGIKSFVLFFWMFITNFKKDHCPRIEWNDPT